MKTAILILIAIVIVLVAGRLNNDLRLQKDVKILFMNSQDFSNKTFNYTQLDGLPKVVQNYFKHVLRDGQLYINSVELIHNGKFRTGKNKKWSKIKGRQYFSTNKPGFIWEGRIKTIVSAKDKYLNDKGSLTIKLLDLFKIDEAKGNTIDQGELLRWLGESFWFPTNLLPSDNLSWEYIDEKSAKLLFNYNDLSLYYDITFNDKNEIIKMETKRYIDELHLKPWIGECSNYKEVEGVKVPFNIKASWVLEDGLFNYVDFNVKEIKFN